MSALLRDASPGLKAALAGNAPLWKADLFTLTLVDGTTVYRWTSFDRDVTYAGNVYSSRSPWIERTTWKVTSTLEVPEMAVKLRSLNGSFAGGAALQAQIVGGLLDGALFACDVAYMTTPGEADTLGVIALFSGKVGPIDCDGVTASISMRGKVNELDQYAPRNLYQVGCNHGFCDAGCTLSRAAFTSSFTVGAAPSESFIPWASAPASPSNWQGGTLAMTSGPASGSRRTIAGADASGLTLAYPLAQLPAAGDGFTAFQGCDKTFDSGSGQSCTDRSNTQHYRGFEFVPPPNASY